MKRTYCDECGELIVHKDKAMVNGKGELAVKIQGQEIIGFYVRAQREHVQEQVVVDHRIDLCEKHFKEAVRGVG